MLIYIALIPSAIAIAHTHASFKLLKLCAGMIPMLQIAKVSQQLLLNLNKAAVEILENKEEALQHLTRLMGYFERRIINRTNHADIIIFRDQTVKCML